MNNILSEKEYQKYILKKLTENGYEVQPAEHYDRLYAISRPELLRFLEKRQKKESSLRLTLKRQRNAAADLIC